MPAADDNPRRTVQALIQAAGSGSRLGRGPKAFVTLGERTLLERAVALFDGLADRIVVAVPGTELPRARSLVGGRAEVIAGGSSRSQTTRLLVGASSAPWLLLHDVVHPFASAALVRRVLDAAIAHGASAPAVPNAEFLYDRDGNPLHPPGAILNGQKPVGLSREKLLAAYRAASIPPGDPSVLEILAAAGTPTRFVAGERRNIKITEPDDLALARAMVQTGF